MSGRVETVAVVVGPVDDGGYGSVSSRKHKAPSRSGDRFLLSVTAVMLALAAIIALSGRASHHQMGIEESTKSIETSNKEVPTARSALHSAPHKPPQAKEALKKQLLAEAFSSYNKKTGYLINRYWDHAFDLVVYKNVDPRVPLSNVIKHYQPTVKSRIHNINLDNTTVFNDTGVPTSSDVVVIIKGVVPIQVGGNYTFSFTSNAGATLGIIDMKTDKSTGIETTASTEFQEQHVTIHLHAPQMVNLIATWRGPDSGVAPILDAKYSGPDTEDSVVDIPGAHWINDKEDPIYVPPENANLHKGFGCRVTYPSSALSELPTNLNRIKNMTPDWVAQIPELDIHNHLDLQKIVTDAKSLGGAGNLNPDRVPKDQVLIYCEGYVNITQGGIYVFDVKNDGGVKLTVDNITLVENRTAHDSDAVTKSDYDPTTADSGDMSLPTGYHEVRLAAILSEFHATARPNGQELGLTYRGPDTLNGDDASLTDARPSTPVPGLHESEAFGDIGHVVTKSGKAAKARFLGGHGKFTPERNPLEHFDEDWYGENKAKAWKRYDYGAGGEDWGKDIDGVATKIIKPWTDNTAQANAYAEDGATRTVPDEVYTRPPVYDPAVVDIGGKGIKWVHPEAANQLSGEVASIGSDYKFTPWSKTIASVPEARNDLSLPDSHEYAGGVGTPPTTFGDLHGQ